jgi:hypothetical protein
MPTPLEGLISSRGWAVRGAVRVLLDSRVHPRVVGTPVQRRPDSREAGHLSSQAFDCDRMNAGETWGAECWNTLRLRARLQLALGSSSPFRVAPSEAGGATDRRD